MTLVKDGNTYLVAAIDKHHASLRVGSAEKFVPNINLSRYDDEAFLNINPKAIVVGNEKPTFANDKIELTINGDVHRFYEMSDKVFEYETVFNSRPAFNQIEYDLLFSEGLIAVKQSAPSQVDIDYERWADPKKALWTDEEISLWITLENVVGSYSFKWHKKNNQYTTGKFCSWYYPHLTDDDGNTVRIADFVVDMKTKRAIQYLSSNWLDNAKYPVKMSGTGVLGKTDDGDSNTTIIDDDYVYALEIGQASEGGAEYTVTELSILTMAGNTRTVQFGLYDESGGNPNSPKDWSTTDGEATTIDNWTDLTPTQSYNIVNGTKYYLAIKATGGNEVVRYEAGSLSYDYDAEAYADPWPDPFTRDGGGTNRDYSAHIEYTIPEAPPAAPPIPPQIIGPIITELMKMWPLGFLVGAINNLDMTRREWWNPLNWWRKR